MSQKGDPAENRFEAYLRQRQYVYEYEPNLGNGKRPDFLVHANGHELVCEVKSFKTNGVFGSPHVGAAQVGARSQGEVLKPARKQITEAAEQLKGISGVPLVVVLTNPERRPVPLDAFSVTTAMYGDVEVEFLVGGNEDTGRAEWRAGRNRKLRAVNPDTGKQEGGNHGYVSAVVVLRQENLAFSEWSRQWRAQHGDLPSFEATMSFLRAAANDAPPHSDDVFVDVFETLSDQAVPLPRDVFNGTHDRRWVPDDARTMLVRLT